MIDLTPLAQMAVFAIGAFIGCVIALAVSFFVAPGRWIILTILGCGFVAVAAFNWLDRLP